MTSPFHKSLTADEIKKSTVDDLFLVLSTGKTGINSHEAKNRLEEYGHNEIEEKKINPFRKLLGYFWGPIPFMIEAAAIISAIISHWEDFWIIISLLLINGIVAFFQEHKADNAINLLKQKLSIRSRALRDGKWVELSSQEIVPGDVIRVRLGDIIPADAKLFDGEYLDVDESALTGESLPVEKHVEDVVYSSSIVQKGEMNALVVSTGMRTFFGKTAKLVGEARTKSHFQKALMKIGNYLIALAVGLIALVFLVAMFRHESLLETLQFALVLMIASIPAALPAVLSVTMAVGATVLAKKQALVSKLTAIEEMAGVDILCADKTGTLTKNELSVAELVTFDKFTDSDLLMFATLASRGEDTDHIDNAIIARAKASGVLEKSKPYKQISFKPFDPIIKRVESKIEDNSGKEFMVSKGAPQSILALVLNKDDISAKVDESVRRLASKGYRSLGVARTNLQGVWEFVGIISLHDPPREDSKETIKTAKTLGINIKMITGDHIDIAKEIARELNLGTNIQDASQIIDKTDQEIQSVVEQADGFAQVFPEHKYKIVGALQAKGHIVGMTGDGVNDAPALKKADVGIAVFGATDVAKSAAHIVLTQPGISVIIDAIQESRKIFQRMNNYAIYRISETIRILFFLVFSIIAFSFYPITPLMIVLLAILNDLPIMTIAYDNVKISTSPERWDMRKILGIATGLGIIGVVSTFVLLYIGMNVFDLKTGPLQSLIYLKLSVAGHMLFFVARTRGHFWTVKPALKLFLAIIVTQTIATIITAQGILVPAIGWNNALFVWGYALAWFLITDFVKGPIYKLLERKGSNLLK
ncbi:plasma-membrane proton-efflux P-type ATPase [Candidatus Nitrosotalea bavarica]|uniref:plasma-membrane proton-efflux P-type ATPase n=1 Tax=Candidatus Nitrosotalea bavarica TaxID=1903277 RepID=UPI000C705665|nr:plasma-membrane proton-efflux P-type ATPase [Candidatus Nitrosotalea bavarica]